jgi:DNA-binding transcriptional ArsR family regulator
VPCRSKSVAASIVHRSVQHNQTLDRTFFALSDPTRRSILERLAAGPATLGELAEPFGLTLNGVKKHVGILETVDLVITAKVGRARECRLGPAQLENATAWIEAYRRAWERRLDRFGAYVEERR